MCNAIHAKQQIGTHFAFSFNIATSSSNFATLLSLSSFSSVNFIIRFWKKGIVRKYMQLNYDDREG